MDLNTGTSPGGIKLIREYIEIKMNVLSLKDIQDLELMV